MSSINPYVPPPPLVRRARRLRWLTTALVAGTAALLAWPLLLGLATGHRLGGMMPATQLVPSLVYLVGLSYLRGAFAAIARGDPFGAATSRALTRLGTALLVGAALQVVLLPNLIFWVAGPGRGGALLNFDVAAFAVGAIGAGLLLIARLFDAAGAMATELEEIF